MFVRLYINFYYTLRETCLEWTVLRRTTSSSGVQSSLYIAGPSEADLEVWKTPA